VAVNSATNRIYVGQSPDFGGASSITVLDSVTRSVLTVINLPVTFNPPIMAVNKITNTVYASIGYQVFVINGATNSIYVVASVEYGLSLAVNETTNAVYTSGYTGSISKFGVVSCGGPAVIDPTSRQINGAAQGGYVQVTAPEGCYWTATTAAPWITVNPPGWGSGNAFVYYSVSQNLTGAARLGAIVISGLPFTLTQSPVSAPGPLTNLFPADRATGLRTTVCPSWGDQPGATYDVYFGTSPTPPLVSTVPSPYYCPGPMSSGTTYYWRVVARNSFGSSSSPILSFTTQEGVDFSGDGQPDLIWQSESTYQATVWFMGGPQGADFQSSGWLAQSGPAGWKLVAAADLNGDAKPDLIWQHETTYQATVWYMGGPQGTVLLASAWLAQSGPVGWKIAAAADLNGDNKPDLLWQHETTYQVSVWYMGGAAGTTLLSTAWVAQTGPLDWKLVAAADLNGDTKPDMVWQHVATYQVSAWYMGGAQGATILTSTWLAELGPLNWKIAGAADLNGDGKPDLLWQNVTTYQASVWYMGGLQGNIPVGAAWLAQSGPTGWRLVARK
jgi:hypothetical protein